MNNNEQLLNEAEYDEKNYGTRRMLSTEAVRHLRRLHVFRKTTGNPSSKYEHRRASAFLRNIQNIRICMGKKPTVSVTYENERISIKTTYLT